MRTDKGGEGKQEQEETLVTQKCATFSLFSLKTIVFEKTRNATLIITKKKL